MSPSKIYVRDESTGKIIPREPVYRSSPRLTEIARAVARHHDAYMNARALDESRVNYFPEGKLHARKKDAGPTHAQLLALLASAKQAGADAIAAASSRVSAALRRVCPDVSEAGNAIIAVATAQTVSADGNLRSRLIQLSKLFAMEDADLEIARWLVYLPPLLTKLKPSEIATFRANLALDETRALFIAEDEAVGIRNHVAFVADAIATHAGVPTHELPGELQTEIFALAAAQQPNISNPRKDVPDETETTSAETTATTDSTESSNAESDAEATAQAA